VLATKKGIADSVSTREVGYFVSAADIFEPMESAQTTPAPGGWTVATMPFAKQTFIQRRHLQLVHHSRAHLHQSLPMAQQQS